jgi:hypothetical protein
METAFYIVLNIKTGNGFESYGRFFIGNDKNFAHSIFQKLKGTKEVNEGDMLHLDFMETKNNLPVNIELINCSLEEMSENCKIITREVFKLFNLEEP